MKRLILPLILLGVAVAIAAGSYFFLIYLQRPHAAEVVVARSDIHTGALIGEGMITSIPWKGKKFPDGFIAVRDKRKVIGRVAAVDVVRGAPICERTLAPAGSPAGLFAKIPEGMRALTVKVDEVSSVAGFSRPGSRVDVLLASTREGPEAEKKGSKIILQNVLVLAAGQRITQLKGKDKPKVVNTVTLLLHPEEAERLALASKMGTLLLSLRGGGDTEIVKTAGSSPDNVWGPLTTEDDPFTIAIEIIQGGEKSKVYVVDEHPDKVPVVDEHPGKVVLGPISEDVEETAVEGVEEEVKQSEREGIPVAKKG